MALDFFAGCMGGCAGVLVGHPFDTVKVRLQTQSFTNPMYRGTFDCFVQIVKRESLFGLYKGMASPLYSLALINAIVFGVQANIQRRLSNPDSLYSHFTAGVIAGLAQSPICSPMELAKTRMQIQGQGESHQNFKHTKHAYTGPADCVHKIFKTEGIKGVFRGFVITCFREGPSFGVYFLSYEYLCRFCEKRYSETALNAPALLVAGGVAGMCSWASTYPIDVMKSRVQADMKGEYTGFFDCCRKSMKQCGPMVFTRGLGSTLLRAFPVNTATFGTVAYVLRVFKADTTEDDGSYNITATLSGHSEHPHDHLHLPVIPNFPSHP